MNTDTNVLKGEKRQKFRNVYKDCGEYCELHITDDLTRDYIVYVDKKCVADLVKRHWSVTFVGKDGYKLPSVFSYETRTKRIPLNKFILGILNDTNIKKIIFINRNPYDYRSENLHIMRYGDTYEPRDRNRNNKLGMCNISELYYNNKLQAYKVTYRVDNKQHAKCFNVSKLGKENALRLAMQFRDSMIA